VVSGGQRRLHGLLASILKRTVQTAPRLVTHRPLWSALRGNTGCQRRRRYHGDIHQLHRCGRDRAASIRPSRDCNPLGSSPNGTANNNVRARFTSPAVSTPPHAGRLRSATTFEADQPIGCLDQLFTRPPTCLYPLFREQKPRRFDGTRGWPTRLTQFCHLVEEPIALVFNQRIFAARAYLQRRRTRSRNAGSAPACWHGGKIPTLGCEDSRAEYRASNRRSGARN
jgi:hypothetical protein